LHPEIPRRPRDGCRAGADSRASASSIADEPDEHGTAPPGLRQPRRPWHCLNFARAARTRFVGPTLAARAHTARSARPPKRGLRAFAAWPCARLGLEAAAGSITAAPGTGAYADRAPRARRPDVRLMDLDLAQDRRCGFTRSHRAEHLERFALVLCLDPFCAQLRR
jgi:hypothetical protein